MILPELRGKAVIITGAASGIGLATAHAFARQQARLLLADIDEAALATAKAAVAATGAEVLAQRVDVSSRDQVADMVATALSHFGSLYALVNNAGITQTGMKYLCDVDEEQFDRLIAINLKGIWLGMKYAIPAIEQSGGGCVVNMSSSAGLVGQAGVSIYAATKHAVLGMTKAAALEYGLKGVRINAVCPGAVDSPIRAHQRSRYSEEEWAARSRAYHPATGRDGTADEVAGSILFLCSDAASNIHGTSLAVDGGRTAQ